MTSLPAHQATVADLIDEYEAKVAAVEDTIKRFEDAFDALQMASTVQGAYVEPVGSRSYLSSVAIRSNLLKSGWKAIYNRLQVDKIASAKDKQLFERTLADPPPLTLGTAKATLGDYILRPRFHILRGLAEAFCDLDPAYKSHSKVRIGVKGLPKRVILYWGEYNSGYGVDKFKNIVNALAAYQGIPHLEWCEILEIDACVKKGEDAVMDGRPIDRVSIRDKEPYVPPKRGITVRKFANGNAHVFFDKWTLLDINRALAEFYGEVLPDAEEEGAQPSASTAVAKDLQFYGSPHAVVEAALEFAGIHGPESYRHGYELPEYRVLEPSCGDGRILDVLRERNCRALGIEYHPGRAAEARAKGHSVVTGNFLEQAPTGDFDFVIMNPPFYGRHYAKHVRHALKFLKPGGVLVAILPATAHYDHDEISGDWRDLPVGSFAESGTNVPTGLMKIVKPREAMAA